MAFFWASTPMRQTDAGDAEFEVGELFAGHFFQGRADHRALPDRGPGDVVDAHFGEQVSELLFGQGFFHCCLF